MGKIEATWMNEEQKTAILLTMEEARGKGVSSAGAWSDGLGTESEDKALIMASLAPKTLSIGFSRRNAQP